MQSSLPDGIERTVLVRSGPSGSASGTLEGEWQCTSHSHSAVSVPGSAPHTATRWRTCWAEYSRLSGGADRDGLRTRSRCTDVKTPLPGCDLDLTLTRRWPSRGESLYRQDGFSTGRADLFCVSLTQATPTGLIQQPLVASLKALPLDSRHVRSPHDTVLVRDEEGFVVAQLPTIEVIEEALAPLDRNA